VWLAIGPVTVEQSREIDGVVAIGLVTVSGKRMGGATSFGATIVLEKTAIVAGNVTAVCAPIDKADGARVWRPLVPGGQLPREAKRKLPPTSAERRSTLGQPSSRSVPQEKRAAEKESRPVGSKLA
jgi:hypothetical protein